MIQLVRTNSSDPDFRALVNLLDLDLQIRDGADHAFFKQFNNIDTINQVVVAYVDDVPVGCGAIKQFNAETAEVKRMFTQKQFRGQGIAGRILTELEYWAKESGYLHTILETGKRQPDAIRVYEKHHYRVIPNFGQYAGVETSICMKKTLS